MAAPQRCYRHTARQQRHGAFHASAAQAAYDDGDEVTLTANLTLYAVRTTTAPATCTVTFDANGGTLTVSDATQPFTQHRASVLRAAAALGVTRSGYVFAGWATDKSATDADYRDGQSATFAQSTTLYDRTVRER